eukprot:scaffold421267_cov60-Attheya_sp.AAC.5
MKQNERQNQSTFEVRSIGHNSKGEIRLSSKQATYGGRVAAEVGGSIEVADERASDQDAKIVRFGSVVGPGVATGRKGTGRNVSQCSATHHHVCLGQRSHAQSMPPNGRTGRTHPVTLFFF